MLGRLGVAIIATGEPNDTLEAVIRGFREKDLGNKHACTGTLQFLARDGLHGRPGTEGCPAGPNYRMGLKGRSRARRAASW